jgi:siroheme synthase (precorrin-2 oxidase/ferrochelatase)
MRDKTFDSQKFCSEVHRQCEKVRENFLTTAVLDNPKRFELWTNRLTLKNKSQKTLVQLSILSWEMEPEVGILLRLEIERIVENSEDLNWIRLLIQSKAHCLLFLQDTKLWHTRDFFGNVFNEKELKKALGSLAFQFKSTRRPRQVQRRRGYQDHGSWRAPHEHHSYYDGTSDQLLVESKRSVCQDTLAFLQAFLE